MKAPNWTRFSNRYGTRLETEAGSFARIDAWLRLPMQRTPSRRWVQDYHWLVMAGGLIGEGREAKFEHEVTGVSETLAAAREAAQSAIADWEKEVR